MTMRVLINCERSGIVREAFRALGHDAWSCDMEPADDGSPHHMQGDAREALTIRPWDLMIAHPPCTFLTVANTYKKRGCSRYTAAEAEQYEREAVAFFMDLVRAPIPRKCIENPVGIMSRWRKPDQIIHPWQFGDDASKATCLWLDGLAPLTLVGTLPGDRRTRRANQTPSGQNKLGPSADRARLRAQTYPGIAQAMATQWGV